MTFSNIYKSCFVGNTANINILDMALALVQGAIGFAASYFTRTGGTI